MTHPSAIIALLNQVGPHSEQAIASALDMSLPQANAYMLAWQQQGLPIDIAPVPSDQHYYALPSGIQLLDSEAIADHLEPTMPLVSFEVFDSLVSTNSHLLEQSTPVGSSRVCLTEAQTAGRGRRGNTWLSAPYRNIMMSMSWGFDEWPADLTSLGLVVALSVAEEINRQFDLSLQIKWPNDIMLNDHKLAGILVDVSGDPNGQCTVVIGLGLNVDQPDWSEQSAAAYRWQDLNGLGVNADRNQLVANIINGWLAMLREFSDHGFTAFAEPWNQLSTYSGRHVHVSDTSGSLDLSGVMVGVDSSGALLLLDEHGVQHTITDSSASVRLSGASV